MIVYVVFDLDEKDQKKSIQGIYQTKESAFEKRTELLCDNIDAVFEEYGLEI